MSGFIATYMSSANVTKRSQLSKYTYFFLPDRVEGTACPEPFFREEDLVAVFLSTDPGRFGATLREAFVVLELLTVAGLLRLPVGFLIAVPERFTDWLLPDIAVVRDVLLLVLLTAGGLEEVRVPEDRTWFVEARETDRFEGALLLSF